MSEREWGGLFCIQHQFEAKMWYLRFLLLGFWAVSPLPSAMEQAPVPSAELLSCGTAGQCQGWQSHSQGCAGLSLCTRRTGITDGGNAICSFNSPF